MISTFIDVVLKLNVFIPIPFTSGKVKVLIESLEKGNYSAIQSDVYDGPLYIFPLDSP
jgi:hypothetical protein